MIYWTVKTVVGGGGIGGFVDRNKDEIRTWTHGVVTAPILQRAIDRKLDSAAAGAKTSSLGMKRYYCLFPELPAKVAADVRASVGKGKKVELQVAMVKDVSGRDITNHYNIKKISEDLTKAVEKLR